jgi:FGFR1 oncogene partner
MSSSPLTRSSSAPPDQQEQDEDQSMVNLKNAVAQTLETKGVLGRIRAQLRAAVFTAIDTQEKARGVYYENNKLNQLQQTEDGRAAIALVRDFLECLDLHSTKSVFLSEISAQDEGDLVSDVSEFADSHGFPEDTNNTSVLMQLIQNPTTSTIQPSPNSRQGKSSPHSSSSLSSSATTRESKTSPSNQTKRSNDNKVRTPTSSSSADNSRSNSSSRGSGNREGKRQSSPRSRMNEDSGNSTNQSNNYDDDDDFEDVQSDGSDDAFEIADDGLVSQSGSFGNDSSEFLGQSRHSTGNRSIDRSTDSLNMSTSIVQDSMDMSIQGSLAMSGYDFVEVAQPPKKEER